MLPVTDNTGDPPGEYNPEGTGGGGGTGTPGIGEPYAGTVVFDFDFNKQESSSVLEIITYANLSSPDDIQFTAYIVLDGVTRQTCIANIILDTRSSNGRIPLSPFAFIEGIAAGVHNVKFVIRNQEVDNVPLTLLPGATIKVTELKQGAR